MAWEGEACDALIALHARRSHAAVVAYRERCPDKPLIVTLTGTDLYRDLPASTEARESLALADRVIVLQEAALAELEQPVRRKARVVYQSANPSLRHAPPSSPFRIAVVGHLRAEKDPLRAVEALAQLDEADVEVVQIGEALDAALGEQAREWMAREPRYRWLGGLPHASALAWMAKSHLLVVSSVMEGGANVIAEAARIGTPVLASRVSGNIGMLGARYPGYYPLGDAAALARLVKRARRRSFYASLERAMQRRKPLFAPAAEARALAAVVKELAHRRSSSTRARTGSLVQSSSP